MGKIKKFDLLESSNKVFNFDEYLAEKNALNRYYEEHPDKLEAFSGAPEKANGVFDIEQLIANWFGDRPININDLFDKFKEKMSDFLKEIEAAGEGAEDLFSIYHIQRTMSNLIEYQNKPTFSFVFHEKPKSLAVVKKYWDKLKHIATTFENKQQADRNWSSNKLKKLAYASGVTPRAYANAIEWIANYTSSSQKKIPKEIYELLQKITVDKNKLPEYVYRGIFYDGKKIKDKEKFEKQWAPGNKPGVKQSKATSWSALRDTAIAFMQAQDFIKDVNNGYFVLLKWKVDPDMVVADLRQLKNMKFWSQQEIIVKSDANDYEVDTILPYAEQDKYNEMVKKISNMSTKYFGDSKAEYINSHFFDFNKMNLDPGYIEHLKSIKNMTVPEASKALGAKITGSNSIKSEKINKTVLLPVLKTIRELNMHNLVEIYTTEELPFDETSCGIGIGVRVAGPWDDTGEKSPFNELIDPDTLQKFIKGRMFFDAKTTITMTNNEYNKFVFEIDLPNKYEVDITTRSYDDPKKSIELKAEFQDILSNMTYASVSRSATTEELITKECNKLVMETIEGVMKKYKNIEIRTK